RADPRAVRVDLSLSRGNDGVSRPSAESPVRGAAAGFPGLAKDIDGQPRRGRFDAGCDQLSEAPVTARPLAAADVGPAWMAGILGSAGIPSLLDIDRGRILSAAARALELDPPTIARHHAPHSEGGPNDFHSNGDYWWPDPEKPDGLPYVRRDGETNPDNFTAHRDEMRALRDAVAALAAAWLATGEEKYAAKAAGMLRIFFLDPSTRMNPHLEYAQAIPGVTPGRGIGIIDTLHLIEIPVAVAVLEESRPFNPELCRDLRGWFRDYAAWMRESAKGREEAATKNNHAVAYFLQLAVFARFTGDEASLAECRRRFKEVFVPGQMGDDGSFPLELARTKPYGYSIFQLDNM